MDKLDTVITGLAAASSALAIVLPDEETRLLAFNALGAIIGGFVGTSIKIDSTTAESDRRTAMNKRWATNCATAIVFAPVLTTYVSERLPNYPKAYLAIACGGILGIVGIIVLCLAIPALLERLKSKVTNQTTKLP